ncbi:MAG TPA: lipopolysaccharide kinase InaA family protein, partial [Pirellulales bacterium]
VACKTFDDWTGGLSWRRFWRWTPGLKRWVIGQALLARGIATPRPCLTWRPSKGPNRGQIFVACEWIAGAETLDAVLVRVAELPDGAARRVALDALAKQVGKLLGDLHRWGATHHDLNAASLLVDHVDWPSLVAGSKIAVKLVNLDSVVLGRSESLAAAAADLQTFAGSIPTAILSDLRTRRRFLSAYFATFRLSAPERRRRAALFAASIPFAGQSPQKTS